MIDSFGRKQKDLFHENFWAYLKEVPLWRWPLVFVGKIKTKIADFKRMTPRAKKYGIRYYYDFKFRLKCRRKEANELRRKKYGTNWYQKRNNRLNRLQKRDGRGCVICGTTSALTIDHIIPISKGGSHHLVNLQVLCTICHLRKNNGEELIPTFREYAWNKPFEDIFNL